MFVRIFYSLEIGGNLALMENESSKTKERFVLLVRFNQLAYY